MSHKCERDSVLLEIELQGWCFKPDKLLHLRDIPTEFTSKTELSYVSKALAIEEVSHNGNARAHIEKF